VGALTTNIWGAAGVLPRDPQNGLKDESLKELPLATASVPGQVLSIDFLFNPRLMLFH
jgi:hypothetical protein